MTLTAQGGYLAKNLTEVNTAAKKFFLPMQLLSVIPSTGRRELIMSKGA
jgi:hypothetical protein